jgi:hypothetical protein
LKRLLRVGRLMRRGIINRRLLHAGIGLVLGLIFPHPHAAAQQKIYRVKYISTENVYLDGGSYDGLEVGDTLTVRRSGRGDALLKINYISESSSACRLLTPDQRVERNDAAILLTVHRAPAVRGKAQPAKIPRRFDRAVPAQTPVPGKRFRTRTSGSVSMQWYQVKDLSPYGFNVRQPSARLSMKIRNFRLEGLNFDVRFRSRQELRSYRLSRPDSRVWSNRLYTLLLSYELPGASWQWQAGRIVSNRLSGLGVIDGLLLEKRIGKNVSLGVVGGTQPKWYYGSFEPSSRKTGVYASFHSGESVMRQWESTCAFAGEYRGALIGREFFYLQNQVNLNRVLFYHSAELDLNRKWRLERARKTVSLTSQYLYSDVKVASWLNAGFSYDDRRQVITFEQRSLADSLLDAALRVGMRGRIRIQLPGGTNVFADAGVRDETGQKTKSTSWSGGFSKSGVLLKSTSVNAYMTSFSNAQITGRYESVRLTQTIFDIHSVSVGYSHSQYDMKSMSIARHTQRFQFDASIQLPGRFFLSEQLEYVWGAEGPGYHVFAELGYRM